MNFFTLFISPALACAPLLQFSSLLLVSSTVSYENMFFAHMLFRKVEWKAESHEDLQRVFVEVSCSSEGFTINFLQVIMLTQLNHKEVWGVTELF